MNSNTRIQIHLKQSLPAGKASFKLPVRRATRLRALSPHGFWHLLNVFAELPVLRRSDWRIIQRAIDHRP